MKTVTGQEPTLAQAVVMKFGGSSLATPELIARAAERVLDRRREGALPVVVVSAMAGETDRLLGLARRQCAASKVSGSAPGPLTAASRAEAMDLVAAAGEQVSAGLMALALAERGARAQPLTASQVRIVSDARFGDADVERVETARLIQLLSQGVIPVVTGFQGVTAEGALTTLGRGGSDTTAVVLAAALGSVVCEVYKDVDGVYTRDPKRDDGAERLERLTYGRMQALADGGAKVLQGKSVRIAREWSVPIHVRSSAKETEGTWIAPELTLT